MGTLFRLQPSLHGALLWAGAALWLGWDALWLAGAPLARVVPRWAGFLVPTIAGERLELARLRRPGPWGRAAVVAAGALLAAGAVLGSWLPREGARAFALGLLALALALGGQDVAWRTVRQAVLPRFVALCLLAGYGWLATAGGLWLTTAGKPHGLTHDAALHAVFLGFVFSMIFGHAPVILPGVARVALPFRRRFYAHWALLHASLALRMLGGLAGRDAWVRWGGLGNGLAVLLFLASTAAAAREAGRCRRAAG